MFKNMKKSVISRKSVIKSGYSRSDLTKRALADYIRFIIDKHEKYIGVTWHPFHDPQEPGCKV